MGKKSKKAFTKEEQEEIGLRASLPLVISRENMHIFLSVTCLMMFVPTMTVIRMGDLTSPRISPEVTILTIWFVGLIFFFLNFQVTRGSFRCFFYLKIYILFFTFLALPSLLTFNPIVEIDLTVLSFLHISGGLFAFYLISTKKYHDFVKVRYDYMLKVKRIRVLSKLNQRRR